MLSTFSFLSNSSNIKINLEPLTVFVGPNGSGKSSICKAITTSLKPVADTCNTSHFHSANATKAFEQAITYALIDLLHANRKKFDELEALLTQWIFSIQRILLPRNEAQGFVLQLVDKYSGNRLPVSSLSRGTLRILAFLTILYQEKPPSIICFEEIENGVHPWLLHKMMNLLKIASTQGITSGPVQVIVTTHSPVVLNCVEPHQVRTVKLDSQGKTQVQAFSHNDYTSSYSLGRRSLPAL